MRKTKTLRICLILATAILPLSACELKKESQGPEKIADTTSDAKITLNLYRLAEAKIHCSVWSRAIAGDIKDAKNSELYLANATKREDLRLSGIEDLRLFLSGIQNSQFTIDEIQSETHMDFLNLITDIGVSTDYVAGQLTARFEEGARKERKSFLSSTGLGEEISDIEAKRRYENRNCEVLDDTHVTEKWYPIFAND